MRRGTEATMRDWYDDAGDDDEQRRRRWRNWGDRARGWTGMSASRSGSTGPYGQGGYYGGQSGYSGARGFVPDEIDVYTITWWSPGPYAGAGPRNYQRSDERVKDDVSDRLHQSGQIDAHDVDVSVSDGVVTLSGTIPTRQMKRMAEDAVESCAGVKDVRNELKVQSHDHRQGGVQGQASSEQGSKAAAAAPSGS
jgi:hypothetical protein